MRLLHGALDRLGRLALVGRVLVEERRLQLPLPACVRREGIAGAHLAPRVEVEQFGGHLLDRLPGLVPDPLPRIAAELVQARRRLIAVVARGTVALELIQPVQRHVEAIPALVFHDRDLEGRLPDGDRLDAAVDPDAMLEVDHVVAGLELAGRRGRRRLAIAPRAPQPPGTAEDLVIGEHPEAPHHEAAIQRADRQGGVHPAAALVQQFVEPLELALVIAQDERWDLAGQHPPQPPDVPLDRLRRKESRVQRRRRIPGRDPRKRRHAAGPRFGRLEQVLARRHLLAQPPGDLQVVGRLAPGARHLFLVGGGGVFDEERVGGQQFKNPLADGRGTRRRIGRPRDAPPRGPAEREDGDLVHRIAGPLRGQVEDPDRLEVVSPPLEPGGVRHPEAVHIDDAAAHAELGDLGHGGHARVAHGIERGRDIGEGGACAGTRSRPGGRGGVWPDPQRGLTQAGGHPGALLGRARGGDQDPQPSLEQAGEGLGAFAGDLVVGLVLA